MSGTERNIAVLVDADNISSGYLERILDEAAKYGNVRAKRAYGDWTEPQLKGWVDTAREHGMRLVEVSSNVKGKNAEDIALVIDAMELYYSGGFDGFCIVSSDSDFTSLATALREHGMLVVGMGMSTTPRSMVSACDEFRTIDVLFADTEKKDDDEKQTSTEAKPGKKLKPDKRLKAVLRDTIDEISDDDGWAHVSLLKTAVVRKRPDFDTAAYGYKKMVPFLKSMSKDFEVREVSDRNNLQNPEAKISYVRNRTK